MNFVNKVVLVTGASSGIPTTQLLVAHGAEMVLIDKNPDKMHKIHEECLKARGKAPLLLKAGITSVDVKKVERVTVNNFRKVGIVLKICGEIQVDSIIEPNLKAFDNNLYLNLRSVFTFARHLMRFKGNIVNVGSVFGDIILYGQLPYNITMSGLEYLTRVSKLELAPYGITVNYVKSRYMKANVNTHLFGDEKAKKPFKCIMKLIPVGRNIKDISQVVVFLASKLVYLFVVRLL